MRGNGYDGYSMSNNARTAYSNDEMPMSKWSKSEILNAISNINSDIDCSKLTHKTLKDTFLIRAGWHHTSLYYNRTDFYAIDSSYVSSITQNDVNELVKKQQKTSTIKRDNSVDSLVDDAYMKALAIVESGMVKTENGAINKLLKGLDFNDAYSKAVDIIKRRDSQKIDSWRKLPSEHRRHRLVNLYDNNIDEYIKEMYASNKLSRNSNVFKTMANYFVAQASK